MNQYLPHYAPGAGKPVFEDADMFTVTVPLAVTGFEGSTPQVEAQVEAQVKAQVEAQVEWAILEACAKAPLASAEIAGTLGHKQLSGNIRKALPRLRSAGLIEYTVPDKPQSRLQKYRLTEKGRATLEARKKD